MGFHKGMAKGTTHVTLSDLFTCMSLLPDT